MALQTRQVTCTLYDQGGSPIVGCKITFMLTSTDITLAGVVSPEIVSGTTDSNGVAVVSLYPNAAGLEGTAYAVKATNPDNNKKFINGTCLVPDANCNLEDILVLEEAPDVAAGTQIFLNARDQALAAAASALSASGSASTASSAASTATTAAGTATTQAGNASASATSAATSASNALASANAAAAAAAVFPVGGTAAQILRKNSSTSFDASWYTLTKSDLGLGNVDNTSDATKFTSPALTGTPTAPTAAVDTNTTQIATTAWMIAQAGSATPLIDGTASAGSSSRFARQDHVHPTDTSRAPLASPGLTGTPTAPTAAADTNTTQIATTAWVIAQAGASAPLINGTAAAGSSPRFSRQDHVHPTDTSRAPLASPGLTGTPTAPTAAVDTNTTQIASTAFVIAQAATATPLVNGTAAAGSSTRFARGDHVHPTDTSRAPLASPAFTGIITGPVFREPRNAVTTNIDCSLGGLFTKTVSGGVTFTVSNVAASGTVTAFILDLTNGGSAVVTWWTGVKWAGGVAPTLTVSGRDMLGFVTHDGGTTWSGVVMGLDIK